MNKKMTIEARLKAREDRLNARANMRLENVKEEITYLKNNSAPIIVNEALDKVQKQVPALGKLTNFVSKKFNDSQKKKAAKKIALEQNISRPTSSFSVREDQKENPILSTLKKNVLPMLYTLGGMQLMSYSLKGAGKMARSGVRRLFGLNKKRR